MKTVILYGRLRKEFGERFDFDIASPGEAIRALEANFRGRFKNALREGEYRIGYGEHDGIAAEMINMRTGQDEIHIEPVVAGSGGGSTGTIIRTVIGASLLVSAAFTGGATFAGAAALTNISFSLGTGLLLSGVSELLSPTPKVADYGNREQTPPSFLFNGALNLSEQGATIPLVYGRMRVGGVTVSTGLTVERKF